MPPGAEKGATFRFIVGSEEAGLRLDRFLTDRSAEFGSRAAAIRLIRSGAVKIDGQPASKSSRALKAGQIVTGSIPPPQKSSIEPELIALDIVYEDDQLMLVNKAAGMLTHPAPGRVSGSLVNAALAYLGEEKLSSIGGVARPGIVHRLDRLTSGLIIVAKTDRAHRALARQLADRSLSRRYLAVAKGFLSRSTGIIDAPIGRSRRDRKKMAVDGFNARSAISVYRVICRLKKCSLIEVALKTGRTHQVRAHLASIGHPLIGDRLYARDNRGFKIDRQALHAWKLKFNHPISGEPVEARADPPEDFTALVRSLGGDLRAILLANRSGPGAPSQTSAL